MTDSKHTPGPWEAWNSHGGRTMRRWRVFSQGKTEGISLPVASLANEDDGVSGDEQAANAYLIASSPEMLLVLFGCLDALRESAKQHRASGDHAHAFVVEVQAEAVRTIIAKATGNA